VTILNRSLATDGRIGIEKQGHSQEFTKGDKPGGLGDGSPQRGPGRQNMETPENVIGVVTKIDLYGDEGTCTHMSPLATPL